jgi:disulfide bond formation protein DsbB
MAWVQIHLPLMMSLTALGIGIGVEHAIAEAVAHSLDPFVVWVLAGSMATALVSIAVTDFATARVVKENAGLRRGILRLGFAILPLIGATSIVLIEGTGLAAIAILAFGILIQVPIGHFVLEWCGRK